MSLAIDPRKPSASMEEKLRQRKFKFLSNKRGPSSEPMTLAEKESWKKYRTVIAVEEVLLVEDDDNNSELLQSLLRFNGVESMIARNATEALVYCKEVAPMAIFMDIGLPDMNGLELTHILRNMESLQGIPIIVISAHASERMRDLAEEAGCIGFIAKPWNPEQIKSQLKMKMSSP